MGHMALRVKLFGIFSLQKTLARALSSNWASLSFGDKYQREGKENLKIDWLHFFP